MGQLARKTIDFLNGRRTPDSSGPTPEPVPKETGVVEDKTIRAVRISSCLFNDEIWLLLDQSYKPKDGLACYYIDELPLLKELGPEELRKLHETKLRFPCQRIIQEGPEKR